MIEDMLSYNLEYRRLRIYSDLLNCGWTVDKDFVTGYSVYLNTWHLKSHHHMPSFVSEAWCRLSPSVPVLSQSL